MMKILLKTVLSFIFIQSILIFGHAQEFSGVDIFPNFQKPMKYPALTPDGKYLVFLAADESSTTAYESHLQSNKWTPPAPFEYVNKLISQTKNEVGGFSFNHDGSVLFFHAKIASDYFDIFFSRKTKEGWGEPQRLGNPISTNADLFSPTISSDNKTLFVLKAKPQAENKNNKEIVEVVKELLLFEKDKENKWIGPKYLPKEFNIGTQETPFICADNNSLFFASKRQDISKTGKKIPADDYNIYYARRIDENNWYYPVYVEKVNTEFDDFSPMVDSKGDYFIMATKKAKKQSHKVYKATLPSDQSPAKTFVLTGTITDLYSKQPIEAKIFIQDAITSVIKGEFQTNDEGQYSVILTQGTFYKIDFSKENYSHTFYYKDLGFIGKETAEKFDVTLYDNVNLELNIYDNELFYPLSPTVIISDSLANRPIAQQSIVNVSKGKYNCNLNIGKNYKIKIESESFEPYETSFDLRTDVVYSNFEKSLELKASRKLLTLNVKDSKGTGITPVNVEVKNLYRDENASSLLSYDDNGNPVLSLRTNNTYELDVTKKGYTYFNTTLDVKTTNRETKDIVLDLLTVETKMIFNNITFETNSAEVNTESYAELNRLLSFMERNPELKIEIAAHTDDIGSNEYNFRLSDKRAESVVKFLISNNISKSRVRSKGYGELQPLVPNDSDENRAKNRRVEIKIIENTTN
ncbi:MAG: OmpA family protein [Prevotellaceae bacterium]|jgi:outer membrane protein OmpA-like peptidoglycan-associated protein|nr:OmpA family protein [Prevotellaceae bacterium]